MAEIVKVTGLRELREALHRLPSELDKGVAHSALRKGAKVIQRAAITNAPQLTGALSRSIFVRNWKRPSPGMDATVSVFVRTFNSREMARWRRNAAKRLLKQERAGKAVDLKAEAARAPNNPFYWKWVEFGFTDRSGKWHAGRRFLRNAFETEKGSAVWSIKDGLGAAIERAARKLNKRLAK